MLNGRASAGARRHRVRVLVEWRDSSKSVFAHHLTLGFQVKCYPVPLGHDGSVYTGLDTMLEHMGVQAESETRARLPCYQAQV